MVASSSSIEVVAVMAVVCLRWSGSDVRMPQLSSACLYVCFCGRIHVRVYVHTVCDGVFDRRLGGPDRVPFGKN